MKTLRLLPKAVQDLDGIWLHIAKDNIAAADTLIDDLTECFHALCKAPNIGAACPQPAPGLRRFSSRGYVIFFSVHADRLIIERVLHGARDIDALFG